MKVMTVFRLDKKLSKNLRTRAEQDGKTMTRIVVEALTTYLAPAKSKGGR